MRQSVFIIFLMATSSAFLGCGANHVSGPTISRAASVEKRATKEQSQAPAPLRPWPSFRGLSAAGVADGENPPLTWNAEKGTNIRWKTPVPGLGHSCPIVWGDRLFVTTAISGDAKAGLRPGHYGDPDSVNDSSVHRWKIYCLNKKSGSILWEHTGHEGVPKVKRHLKGTHANPTPATDGEHVVANFGSEGNLCCYNLECKPLWKVELGALDAGVSGEMPIEWGFGSSPIIHRNLVIVQCDRNRDSFLAAYDLSSGSPVWRTLRDEVSSWATPTIVEGPNRVELVTNGCAFIRGYDPLSGKELWRLRHGSQIAVPTPVFGNGLIFVMSGKGDVHPVFAIRPGAVGDISLKEDESSNNFVAWSQQKNGPYLPTPLVYGDYLYTCDTRTNVVTCYEAKTGKQVYRERLPGHGTYTASAVAADGRIYFVSEESGVCVVKAGPKLEVLAVNPMDDLCFATPAIADGMIFIRSQHFLYGIGESTR